jgi:hypothetical protein
MYKSSMADAAMMLILALDESQRLVQGDTLVERMLLYRDTPQSALIAD